MVLISTNNGEKQDIPGKINRALLHIVDMRETNDFSKLAIIVYCK